jgi:hypothetical protein
MTTEELTTLYKSADGKELLELISKKSTLMGNPVATGGWKGRFKRLETSLSKGSEDNFVLSLGRWSGRTDEKNELFTLMRDYYRSARSSQDLWPKQLVAQLSEIWTRSRAKWRTSKSSLSFEEFINEGVGVKGEDQKVLKELFLTHRWLADFLESIWKY